MERCWWGCCCNLCSTSREADPLGLRLLRKQAMQRPRHPKYVMEMTTAIDRAEQLVERSPFVMVGSLGDQGFPNVKAMFRLEHDGIKTFWLSTNTSSVRVSHLRDDARACLYFADTASFEGLLLVGEVTVRTDAAAKERLWQPGWERYYPEGPTDPDYCVLEFRAQRGNYYHNLDKMRFDVQRA